MNIAHTSHGSHGAKTVNHVRATWFLEDKDLGFIAEPHVSAAAVVPPGEGTCLLLASDGRWDLRSEVKAASMVFPALSAGTATCAHVADALRAHAVLLRSKGDITVMVVEVSAGASEDLQQRQWGGERLGTAGQEFVAGSSWGLWGQAAAAT